MEIARHLSHAIARTASVTNCPCESNTSTCCNWVTTPPTVGFFLGMAILLMSVKRTDFKVNQFMGGGSHTKKLGHAAAPSAIARTYSAIARLAVNPGLSIPKRLIRPGMPCARGPSIQKSAGVSPCPDNLGLTPA